MIALLLACTGADPVDRPLPPVDLLARYGDPGPYGIGYRESSITWQPPLGDPRTNRLAAWYPTEDAAGAPVTYDAMFPAGPEVLGGAAPVSDPLPLLVFSHGYRGYAENSSFLAEHFASHGWLVLAPDHTGDTTLDDPARETDIYWQRPLDIGAVLDEAEASWSLSGEIVAAGHSFGGYTTNAVGGATYAIDGLCDGPDAPAEFCSTMDPAQEALFRAGLGDPRPAALVAMAAGDADLFGDGVAAIGVPELQMTGGLDPSTDGDVLWAALDDPEDRRVHVPLGGHNVFTDFSGALDPAGAIDPDEGFRIVRTYALAFAELHARGADEARPLLDGDAPVSDEAELARH